MDNWNRWGAADERGAANLIDADAVRRGIEQVGPIVTRGVEVFPSQVLVVAPLPLVGAVGSPVSPVAVI